jgi:hypothetical protein
MCANRDIGVGAASGELRRIPGGDTHCTAHRLEALAYLLPMLPPCQRSILEGLSWRLFFLLQFRAAGVAKTTRSVRAAWEETARPVRAVLEVRRNPMLLSPAVQARELTPTRTGMPHRRKTEARVLCDPTRQA